MRFRNTLRDKLFMESVFDMFMEGLVLDEDFKETYKGNFYQMCQEEVTKLFESGQLNYKNIEQNGSETVKFVLALCEETADKEAKFKFDVSKADNKSDSKKLLTEKKKDCTCEGACSCNITLSKEAKGDFDEKKAFETNTIGGVVKDKVVQVIRDEQKQSDKEQEIDEAISTKLNPEPELDEGAEPKDAGIKTDEGDVGGLSEGVRMVRRPNKVAQYSLFKSLQVSIANKNLQEMKSNLSEDESIELNMDLVLAESIAYYTLLETLYTTRLVSPNASELRGYAKGLTLVKKEK
jgi:hypothetical protein